MPTGEEISWWREVLGAISAALIAVATWSFIAGRKSREFEQQLESLKSTQEQIVADLRKEILTVVQQSMSTAALQQLEQAGEIRTNIAVIQALIGEMQEDIKAIFERLERRKIEIYPPPHGERREQ
ncbi:hypothetical protein Despr_0179 [Desulfobulbus propionicus DSM 2032]|uniref:Uncharacterized protein n=1 Tax=Desulfobulbus propionicus (strain ATCC 33891 / DSM 2032 / VKM B-1956 / 1pr3) TaxID=577650 RepID=A0A7U3YJ58_DESPD|nr:hypothetical protein [Desulfobulbus propionicus]ADW16368.1 hypothetical protein Despr_0179 [Desulfobulbus propionicus DSM 2032]